MTLGYWLSSLMDSYIKGFGLTTLLMIVIFVVFTVFRKKLFVHPIVQAIITSAADEAEEDQPAAQ